MIEVILDVVGITDRGEVVAVTGVTICRSIRVTGTVATGAVQRLMCPRQGELRGTVVERRWLPSRRIVTTGAVVVKFVGLVIWFLGRGELTAVAGKTEWRSAGVFVGMAVDAGRSSMSAGQGKASDCVVEIGG